MKTRFGDIPQGSDLEIPFQYRGQDNEGIDLNGLDTILVVLYYEGGKNLEKYTWPTKSGYKDVEIDDAPNGKFHVKLQESTTTSAPVGIVHAEVKIKKSDSDWEDNDWKHMLTAENLLRIVPGRTTHENP